MKHADIQRLHAAGLITDDQRRAILDHFHLQEDSPRFLAVVLFVGAILVSAGVILLISANWNEIPAFAKLGGGLLLQIGAYVAGAWLRDGSGRYPRVGEAFYLMGALLFLANIALIGQIYHLASNLPNALLAWWLGIAALPWILRSRALHVLGLLALVTWFGSEAWRNSGWLNFGTHGFPLMLLALLGLAIYAFGLALRPTSWSIFSADSERFGLILFVGALFPFAIEPFQREAFRSFQGGTVVPFAVLAVVALGLLAWGLSRDTRFSGPWRMVWGGSIAGLVAFLSVLLVVLAGDTPHDVFAHRATFLSWVSTVLLGAFALLQVRVGVHLGAAHLVNFGILLVALLMLATYLALIESMGRTGMVFIASGILLMGFGIYLEKQRRKLLQRIRPQIV